MEWVKWASKQMSEWSERASKQVSAAEHASETSRAEQLKERVVWVNERTDEQMAQYCGLDSWLFWPTVPSKQFPDLKPIWHRIKVLQRPVFSEVLPRRLWCHWSIGLQFGRCWRRGVPNWRLNCMTWSKMPLVQREAILPKKNKKKTENLYRTSLTTPSSSSSSSQLHWGTDKIDRA